MKKILIVAGVVVFILAFLTGILALFFDEAVLVKKFLRVRAASTLFYNACLSIK